ncbi:VanZ like family protein [Roseovarius tolerans]|uniref:VanZ like family protein n=1 Tax=Roseovarius tolerans TaxID=74031 RepID=A0A0L6CVK0_9RHOB|nr:VanZ family protein [Roseovarius tolerans]KNX41715.1 VanZ like family protein [Roseovarius tolerans]
MTRFMIHCVTLVLALIIATLTLLQVTPGPQGLPGLDKLAHFLAFGALAAPLAFAYPRHWRAVALAVLAYGGLIEIVQPYMGRSAEWADLLADGVGAFLGAWGAVRIGRGRRAV